MDYTFIIPAYNAEKTISETVDSIISKVPDSEIIIVENGSTDGTCKILEGYHNNHVICLHSEKGVSNARNAGLKNASGKWVVFVDADDLWAGTAAEIDKLTQKYSNAEIIICSYYKDEDLIKHDFPAVESEIGEDHISELLAWMIEKPTLRTEVWAKIFNREFLIKNQILFDNELAYSEDAEFIIHAFEKCNCAAVTNSVIYKFSSGTPSTMRSADGKKTKAYIHALKKIDRYKVLHQPELEDSYRSFIISHLNLIAVHEIYDCNIQNTYAERKQALKKLVQEDVFQESISKLTIKNAKNVFLLPGYLLKKHLYLLSGCIFRIRAIQNKRRYKKYARGNQ